MNMFRNEAGQAIIEYVLILIVVLGIFFGGLYQLNTGFKDWANNYFGEYLSCLLESGELPALGGAGGECSQFYKPFTLSGGRPPVVSSDGGTTETGSPNQSPKNNAVDQSARDGSASVVQVLPTPSSAQWGSAAGRRFRASPENDGSSEDGGANTGSAQITNLGDGQGGKVVRIPVKDYGLSRGWAGRRDNEDDEKKDKIQTAATVAGVAQENTSKLIRVERKVSSEAAPEIEEFTFGKFLRILLIAAIVIAIVFFIGSQILQVSKSLD